MIYHSYVNVYQSVCLFFFDLLRGIDFFKNLVRHGPLVNHDDIGMNNPCCQAKRLQACSSLKSGSNLLVINPKSGRFPAKEPQLCGLTGWMCMYLNSNNNSVLTSKMHIKHWWYDNCLEIACRYFDKHILNKNLLKFVAIPWKWTTECFKTDCGHNLLIEISFSKIPNHY